MSRQTIQSKISVEDLLLKALLSSSSKISVMKSSEVLHREFKVKKIKPFAELDDENMSVASFNSVNSGNTFKTIDKLKYSKKLKEIRENDITNRLPLPPLQNDSLLNQSKLSSKIDSTISLSYPQHPLTSINFESNSLATSQSLPQSIDVILAKADRRARKQQKAVDSKQHICDEKNRYVSSISENKRTRGQAVVADLRTKQIQMFWLSVLASIQFTQGTNQVFEFKRRRLFKASGNIRSGNTSNNGNSTIHRERLSAVSRETFRKQKQWRLRATQYPASVIRAVLKWRSLVRRRKLFLFRSKLTKHMARILVAVRYFKAQLAARIVIDALREMKEEKRAKLKRFSRHTHTVTRAAKDFLACKAAKIKLLQIILEREERHYVRDVLRKRSESKWSQQSRNSLSEIRIDNRTMNEMNKQDKSWRAVDAKMEEVLAVHRKVGTLETKTEDSEVDKHVLPRRQMHRVAKILLERKRHEHLLMQKDVFKRKVIKKQFDSGDAWAMLRGNTDEVLSTALQLLQPKRYSESLPFLLFCNLSKNDVRDILTREHDTNGTFHISAHRVKKQHQLLKPIESAH